jgi:hypothetical protein
MLKICINKNKQQHKATMTGSEQNTTTERAQAPVILRACNSELRPPIWWSCKKCAFNVTIFANCGYGLRDSEVVCVSAVVIGVTGGRSVGLHIKCCPNLSLAAVTMTPSEDAFNRHTSSLCTSMLWVTFPPATVGRSQIRIPERKLYIDYWDLRDFRSLSIKIQGVYFKARMITAERGSDLFVVQQLTSLYDAQYCRGDGVMGR